MNVNFIPGTFTLPEILQDPATYFPTLLEAIKLPIAIPPPDDLPRLAGRVRQFVGKKNIPQWLLPYSKKNDDYLQPRDIFWALKQNNSKLIERLIARYPEIFTKLPSDEFIPKALHDLMLPFTKENFPFNPRSLTSILTADEFSQILVPEDWYKEPHPLDSLTTSSLIAAFQLGASFSTQNYLTLLAQTDYMRARLLAQGWINRHCNDQEIAIPDNLPLRPTATHILEGALFVKETPNAVQMLLKLLKALLVKHSEVPSRQIPLKLIIEFSFKLGLIEEGFDLLPYSGSPLEETEDFLTPEHKQRLAKQFEADIKRIKEEKSLRINDSGALEHSCNGKALTPVYGSYATLTHYLDFIQIKEWIKQLDPEMELSQEDEETVIDRNVFNTHGDSVIIKLDKERLAFLLHTIDIETGAIQIKTCEYKKDFDSKASLKALIQAERDIVDQFEEETVEGITFRAHPTGAIVIYYNHPQIGVNCSIRKYGLIHARAYRDFLLEERAKVAKLKSLTETYRLGSFIPLAGPPNRRIQFTSLSDEHFPATLFLGPMPLYAFAYGNETPQGCLMPLGRFEEDLTPLKKIAPFLQDLSLSLAALAALPPPTAQIEMPSQSVEVDLDRLLTEIPLTETQKAKVEHFNLTIRGGSPSIEGWNTSSPVNDSFRLFQAIATNLVSELLKQEDKSLLHSFIMTLEDLNPTCSKAFINLAKSFYETLKLGGSSNHPRTSIDAILSHVVQQGINAFTASLLTLETNAAIKHQSSHVLAYINKYLHEVGIIKELDVDDIEDPFADSYGSKVFTTDTLDRLIDLLLPFQIVQTFHDCLKTWYAENQSEPIATVLGALRFQMNEALKSETKSRWIPEIEEEHSSPLSSSSSSSGKRSAASAELDEPALKQRYMVERILEEGHFLEDLPTLKGLLFLLEAKQILVL